MLTIHVVSAVSDIRVDLIRLLKLSSSTVFYSSIPYAWMSVVCASLDNYLGPSVKTFCLMPIPKLIHHIPV